MTDLNGQLMIRISGDFNELFRLLGWFCNDDALRGRVSLPAPGGLSVGHDSVADDCGTDTAHLAEITVLHVGILDAGQQVPVYPVGQQLPLPVAPLFDRFVDAYAGGARKPG
ncbi:hypothetical protein ACFTS5_06605 [Nocardia sp. NPDC056952]|uniref:hypothetical protein n=1 Tax=Nocardia sp. NPDC056952 TaxID=3345979 RepID=UPI00362A9885